MEIKIHSIKIRMILLGAALLLLAACQKDKSNTASTDLPVVQAYLIPGHMVSVKVYLQKALTDTAKYGTGITGLQLYVSDGTNKVLLTETVKGTYTYSDPGFLVTGKSYTLQFTYNGISVSAQSIIPAASNNFTVSDTLLHLGSSSGGPNSQVDTVGVLAWNNPDSLNHVVVFYNNDHTAFPINSFGGSNGSSNFELNAARTSIAYLTPRTFSYYGDYQVILFTVNPEYINFLKTNTSGTSQNLTSGYTNIVNGFGIFTGMLGDTLKLTVTY